MKGMRKLLENMENVHNYIDELLIHEKSWEEHLVTQKELLEGLCAAGLTVRPTKCEFGPGKVEFLGHEFGQGNHTKGIWRK